MRLVLDAAYPNRMSYLDEWKSAWLRAPDLKNEYVNIATLNGILRAKKMISNASQIVILHSCTADTNLWLKPIMNALEVRKAGLIMFLGNEYSSPTVSMDERMRTVFRLCPEILASQLSQEAASWLYEGSAKKILSVPQGMPEPLQLQPKKFDFSFRGFKYPSFILGNKRNLVADKIEQDFKYRGLTTNYSLSNRLTKPEWMKLLSESRVTAASPAGSSRVFKSDEVWKSLRQDKRINLINSDNKFVHAARFLPHELKSSLRKRIIGGRTVYGSLHDDTEASELLRRQVHESTLPSVEGRTISSRHFDAIAAGCWQILEVGNYNGLLLPLIDYTPLTNLDDHSIKESIDHALDMANPKNLLSVQSRVFSTNSYSARVDLVLKHLG